MHLLVRVRRYECTACERLWSDDLTGIAPQGRRMTDAAVWWACAEIVLKSKSVPACANDLACSWGAASQAVLAKGMDALIGDASRFEGVESIGVDEHVWRHTKLGNRYVTVIVWISRRGGGAGRRV